MTTKPTSLSVVAQVIEAIHDCWPIDDGLRKALEDLIVSDEYYRERVGLVVPLSEFPTWNDEARNDLKGGVLPWACLHDVISEARENELRHGALPTPDELLHVARYVVSDGLECDGDEPFPVAFLYRLAGSGGREAWGVVYQRGGGWGILEYEFDGPFLTREQAQAAIAARGFTDPEQVTIGDVSIMLPDSEDL